MYALLSLGFFLLPFTTAAPVSSATSSAPSSTPTVPYASNDYNDVLWGPESNIVPQPIHPVTGALSLGGTILGPENVPIELENPDLLAPPTTDNGAL